MVVKDFGFAQGEWRFQPRFRFCCGASLEELRVKIALRQRAEIVRYKIAFEVIVARF